MTDSNYRLRRATSDDLHQLLELWQAAQLPALELEKRFTEFQVAEAPDGKIVGALGLQLSDKQGNVHSEAIPDFSLADLLRPLLWQRIQSVAANHGLVRFWSQESAPFWKQNGFVAPDAAAQRKFPAPFGPGPTGWLTLRLKDEVNSPMALMEQEFARFREAEKEETERRLQQARFLKFVATAIAVVLFLFVIAALFYVARNRERFGR